MHMSSLIRIQMTRRSKDEKVRITVSVDKIDLARVQRIMDKYQFVSMSEVVRTLLRIAETKRLVEIKRAMAAEDARQVFEEETTQNDIYEQE